MDKAALVSVDIALGDEIVRAVEASGIQLKMALWANFSEYGDWRLVLASPELDKPGLRAAYGAVHKALESAGIGVEQIPPILILSMVDSTVKALRCIFAKTKSVAGMRLGGQLLGDRFIDDAFVYLIR